MSWMHHAARSATSAAARVASVHCGAAPVAPEDKPNLAAMNCTAQSRCQTRDVPQQAEAAATGSRLRAPAAPPEGAGVRMGAFQSGM